MRLHNDKLEDGCFAPAIVLLLGVILAIGISWGASVGIIYLITRCFSLQFNMLYATGIWLMLVLVGAFFGGRSQRSN